MRALIETGVPVNKEASSAFGAVGEHLLIAELLSRGHKVAIPVVDDDGVDMIVDYSLTVQVKSCNPILREPVPGHSYMVHSWCLASRGKFCHADIFALYSGHRWWFVPRDVLAGKVSLSLYDGGSKHLNSLQAEVMLYENAWEMFT